MVKRRCRRNSLYIGKDVCTYRNKSGLQRSQRWTYLYHHCICNMANSVHTIWLTYFIWLQIIFKCLVCLQPHQVVVLVERVRTVDRRAALTVRPRKPANLKYSQRCKRKREKLGVAVRQPWPTRHMWYKHGLLCHLQRESQHRHASEHRRASARQHHVGQKYQHPTRKSKSVMIQETVEHI